MSHPKGEFSIQLAGGDLGLASRLGSGHNEFWGKVPTGEDFNAMVQLTETAVSKVREILDGQDPKPSGLRIAVVGGGCSGFSYSMAFENTPNMLDKTYSFDGLKVFIDQASLLYLDGVQVDYVETMEGSGFKFNNPNVKNTCGCGSSFSV
jgi:iron-sulfur cluster assembly accessory protein